MAQGVGTMKKLISIFLTLTMIMAIVPAGAYEFKEDDIISIDAFDQGDYDTLKQWFMWLPMDTYNHKTYHELLEEDFGRTMHELFIPFNIGRIEDPEFGKVIDSYGYSTTSAIYYLDEIQQTFNSVYGTNLDMQSLDGTTLDDHPFIHVIDNYFIVEFSPHGINVNPNPKGGNRLGENSEYWTWYYQDDWNTNDYIYTIVSHKNVAGYDVRTIDYIGYEPPSDELLASYANDNTSVKVIINDTEISFDQSPIIVDGRTLVPLRAIFEEMNCGVEWIGDNREINVYQNNNQIMKLHIDSTIMWTEQNPSIELDVPAQIVNDRTLVPVRAISESLGAEVNWNNNTRTVEIAYSEPKFECKENHSFVKALEANGVVFVPQFMSTNGGIVCKHGNVDVVQIPKSIDDIGYVTSMSCHKNKLYFLMGTGASSFAVAGIYRCDFNGKKVEEIADNASNYSTCFIIGDDLYYDAANGDYFDEVFKQEKKQYDGGIYKVNLNSGKSTKIINKRTAKLYYCDKEKIYYSTYENNKEKYYSSDLNGRNVKADNGENIMFNPDAVKNAGVVYTTEKNNLVCSDINGADKKTLVYNTDRMTVQSVTDKYVYYTVMDDHTNEGNGYNTYVYRILKTEDTDAKISYYGSEIKNDNNRSVNYSDSRGALIQYAKKYLSVLYEDNATGKRTYTDVRFLFADVSGDDESELLAVGVLDNEMRYFEIYRYENGNIKKIIDNYIGHMRGWSVYLSWYDNGVRLDCTSSSSRNGFLHRLMKYNNNDDWVDVYNSYIDYDFDKGGSLRGYIVNGEYVSEEDFDNAQDKVSENLVDLSDFVSINEL